MPRVTVDTTIARPADEVWAAIGEFGNLNWQEAVESCEVTGDLRIAKMAGIDLVVDEHLVHHDDAQRTYTYAVVAMRGVTDFELGDGNVLDLTTMIDHHRAMITVVPLDDATCRVDYELEIDVVDDPNFESTAGQYQSVIDDLKNQLERRAGARASGDTRRSMAG